MKKIGILGGTFDPIHIGHLIAAEQSLYYADLDEIWFMPANTPPHKMESKVTEADKRIEMVRRITKLNAKYKICTIELERDGPSYTIETMKRIIHKYPTYKFSFIIGGDMINYLPKWYGIQELFQLITFIGLERPGHDIEQIEENLLHLGIADYNKKLKIIPMPQLDISSSNIRERVRIGRSIRYLVPEVVEDFIKEHHLYED